MKSYAEQCLVSVAWVTPDHVRHGQVTADLGLDAPPDPPFTAEEMQVATYAAKKALLTALRKRTKKVSK